ncbi:hypothetical protein [Legionella tunisiensis]|uniref:hypothetical protein n=1 Tax=Legionella tunisiensis TaxID=1034944 RepID=UPI0018DD31AB|nr:hypothetical protein [Legionella tunisiensis]
MPTPITVGEYLDSYSRFDISSLRDDIVTALIDGFEPFDDRPVDALSILSEPVDIVVGIAEDTIIETIEKCIEVQRTAISTSSLSGVSLFTEKSGSGSVSSSIESDYDTDLPGHPPEKHDSQVIGSENGNYLDMV